MNQDKYIESSSAVTIHSTSHGKNSAEVDNLIDGFMGFVPLVDFAAIGGDGDGTSVSGGIVT
jgi:hypothetical protein